MPSLPIELERLIFELAILQDTNHPHKVQIMLVAKRVYEWTRPLLYRVVIADFTSEVCGDEFVEFVVIRNRNARMADIAPFTRHFLCRKCQESHLIELLSTFRNIENLVIFPFISITPDILKSMNGLPLRRISLWSQWTNILHDAVNHCPTFRNVTHLELMSLIKSTWDDYKPLVEFPNLTHLCSGVRRIEDEVFLELLRCCPLLQVLAYLPSMVESILQFGSLRASDEARFLVLETKMDLQNYVADWGRSAKGQIGFWELADIIVEARQRKFFKVNPPVPLPRKTWMKYLNDDGIRWYKEWSGEEVESEV